MQRRLGLRRAGGGRSRVGRMQLTLERGGGEWSRVAKISLTLYIFSSTRGSRHSARTTVRTSALNSPDDSAHSAPIFTAAACLQAPLDGWYRVGGRGLTLYSQLQTPVVNSDNIQQCWGKYY